MPTQSPEKFSCLLALLYGSVTSNNWQPFLQQLMHATQSNKAIIFLNSSKPSELPFLNIAANFSYPEQALINYITQIEDDPYYQESKLYPEGDICEPGKYVDLNTFCQTDYYQQIYLPMQTWHALGLIVLRDGHYDSALIINRAEDAPAYQQQQYLLLDQLKPHVQQAMRLFTLFRGINRQQDMLQAVLNQSDKALIVIDADSKIMLTNEPAATLLARLPYWAITANTFVLRNKAQQQNFMALLQACLNGEVTGQDKLYLQPDDTNLQLCMALAPLQYLQLDDDLQNQQYCLLSLQYQQQINWPALQTEYGLTKRELELVQALHNNCKLTELSEQMAVSYNTLRRHLQAVFKKCRVNSQSELMLLLNRFG